VSIEAVGNDEVRPDHHTNSRPAILTPTIERRLERHERIRVLVQIGPGFVGYAPSGYGDTGEADTASDILSIARV